MHICFVWPTLSYLLKCIPRDFPYVQQSEAQCGYHFSIFKLRMRHYEYHTQLQIVLKSYGYILTKLSLLLKSVKVLSLEFFQPYFISL